VEKEVNGCKKESAENGSEIETSNGSNGNSILPSFICVSLSVTFFPLFAVLFFFCLLLIFLDFLSFAFVLFTPVYSLCFGNHDPFAFILVHFFEFGSGSFSLLIVALSSRFSFMSFMPFTLFHFPSVSPTWIFAEDSKSFSRDA
jgi:hypothetical protein